MDNEHDNTSIYYGQAVKRVGENRYGGYLVYFSPDPSVTDLDGEYFTAETDFQFEGFPVEGKPVLFHHAMPIKTMSGQVAEAIKAPIGKVVMARKDDTGIWAEVVLTAAEEYAEYIRRMAEEGKLGWSSGALPQTVEVDGRGLIKSWHIIEASLTPTPAMPIATRVNKKAIAADALTDPTGGEGDAPITQDTQAQDEPTAKSQSHKDTEMETNMLALISAVLKRIGAEMTGADVAALIDELTGTMPTETEVINSATPEALASADGLPAKSAARVVKEVTDRMNRVKAASVFDTIAAGAVKGARSPFGGGSVAPTNATGQTLGGAASYIPELRAKRRYQDMDLVDLSMAQDVLTQFQRLEGIEVSGKTMQGLRLEFAAKAAHAANDGKLHGVDEAALESMIKSVKADELNHTTNNGFGQQWVPTLWRETLLRRARLANRVLPLINVLGMNAKTEIHPTESTDPTVYFVAETTDETQINPAGSAIPDSKIGTSNQTFTAKKLALRTMWSSELDEDSIVAYVRQAREQVQRAMEDAIENVLLNGDTATSGNINLDGGTPPTAAQYTIFDAIIKAGLANGVDAGGASVTLRRLRQTRFKLNREGNTAIEDLAIIVGPETYANLLSMDEFVTMDKMGSQATALTGQMGTIDGIPVIVTSKIQLAAANGKVSSTAGNNTLGRALFIYRPYWFAGMRRQIIAHMARAYDGESYQLVMTARMDLKPHTDGLGAALLYDLGV